MKRTDQGRYEVIYDKIMRHYNKGDVLPDDLADRLKRWKTARTYFLDIQPHTDYDVVQLISEEFGVSEGTAWNDVRDCKRFFASMEQVNIEFEKVMLRQKIMKLEHTTTKDQVRAICHANLIKLNGFDKPVPEESGSKQIILNIDFNPARIGAKPIPNLLGVVEKFIGEKAKRELMIEDTDFEMLPANDGAQPA